MLSASRNTSSSRPFRSHSKTAVLTALVCFAAQLLGFAHLLLVRHSTCAEHNEVVHVGPQTGARATSPPAARPSRVQQLPAGADSHGDSHCLLAISRRRDQALPAPDSILLPEAPPVANAPRTFVHLTAVPAVPLLRLAPKNSPPA